MSAEGSAGAPAAPGSGAAAGAAPPAPPTMTIGGESVTLLNDGHFSTLRLALGYEPWLGGALAGFDWGRMAAGGGKGGDKMARTPCKRLFVKEVSGGDLATLSHQSFLKAYVARVSSGKSLIVHIVAHFRRAGGGTCMVMNNWLPVRCCCGARAVA